MRRFFRRYGILYLLLGGTLVYFYIIMTLKIFQNQIIKHSPIKPSHVAPIEPQIFINKRAMVKSNLKKARRIVIDPNIKYILLWTAAENVPFVYLGKGQSGFIERNCTYTNCYVTDNRYLYGSYEDMKKFDVVAFNGPEIIGYFWRNKPRNRAHNQKYVFASIESSFNYPVCAQDVDNFFNWTWTFKLTSDARWGYFIVRDANKKIIGPNVEMHWLKQDEMDPVSEEFKEKLKSKTKAAAWFVSNCHTRSLREKFVKTLMEELKQYGLTIDIYGKCGSLSCPRENHNECIKMIEKDYFFYLAFENSFSEDYVTEKLLHPLQNNAVPIVYGGANYTRFMPDGIYLNARELRAERLAAKMNELILNPDLYAEYFRWKNHYSYHSRSESVETDDYCGFCALLNNEKKVKEISTYPDFRKWWNNPYRC